MHMDQLSVSDAPLSFAATKSIRKTCLSIIYASLSQSSVALGRRLVISGETDISSISFLIREPLQTQTADQVSVRNSS